MPTLRPGYLPAIDGLRAIAVLSVIIFHADFLVALPGGFTGVDLFFVISGYVISQSLAERRASGPGAYLKEFYRRRFLRILPALLAMLVVSFLISALFMPQFWLSELIDRTGLAAFFGLSNLVLAGNTDTYFAPGAELNPYLHTWSLGVEEQFYVIFPIMFYLWLRFKQRNPLVWALLPVLALVSLAVSAIQTTNNPPAAFYLLPGRFWELAAGAILFQIIDPRRACLRSRAIATALLAGGFTLLLAGFVWARPTEFPFPWALVTVLGAVLTIAALALPAKGYGSPFQRLLQGPWVTYIGRLSYSLYLWHWPVLVFLRWTIGTEWLYAQLLYPALVMALAAASYHWIETPARTGKSIWQRDAWRTCAVGFSAVALLWWAGLWVTDNRGDLSLSQTRDTYTWYAYKHYPREDFSRVKDPRVNGRQLFVLGDSHTAAYRTLLNIASLKLGIKVVEYEQGGCGVVTLMAADPPSCAERLDADLSDIEGRANPGDIVFLASLRMPELQGVGLDKALALDTAQSREAARRSADAVLSRLAAANVQVLIDAPKPLFKAPPHRCSDWFNRMNPICAAGLTVERAQLERLRAPQLELLSLLQRKYAFLTVWDPFALLCPGPVCSAYAPNGQPLFFDSNHLSGHGNRVLEPSFTAVLLNLWVG